MIWPWRQHSQQLTKPRPTRTLIIAYFGGPIDGLEMPTTFYTESLEELDGPLMTDFDTHRCVYHYEALVKYTPAIGRYPMNLVRIEAGEPQG